MFVFVLLTGLLLHCKPPAGKREESGYEWASRVASGHPVAVMMTVYRTTMLADGKDRCMIRIAVTDSAAREISSARNTIRIYCRGDARILPTHTGEELSTGTDTSGLEFVEKTLQDGLILLSLQAGTHPGIVKVEARSEGLQTGWHEIHTIPADVILLQPREDQLVPTSKAIDRMIGADISFLPEMEAKGKKFYENGTEKDGLRIFREHGFNYIRLRIFVNPENEHGYSPGKGYCGLEHTLKMAKRVHEAGMKLLLDFHYSDYWADPQQQNKPAAWAGLDFSSLKDTVRAYTERTLRAFIAQGTPVNMVQVGNEINHGLLWPDGHISRLEALSELLKAGTEGVRAADPEIPVMMHLALGGQNEEAVFWLNNMIARGLPFDMIGLSYYPGWHGTLDDLFYNLNDLVTRYNKPVNVVEYSIFPREIHQIVFGLPGDLGKGTCIWEPIIGRGGLVNRKGEVTGRILVYDELSREYLGYRQDDAD